MTTSNSSGEMTSAASSTSAAAVPATFSYAAVASSNTSSTASKKPTTAANRGSTTSPSQANGASTSTSSTPAPATKPTPTSTDRSSKEAREPSRQSSPSVADDASADDKDSKKVAVDLKDANPPTVNPWTTRQKTAAKPAAPAATTTSPTALPSPPASESSKSPSTGPVDAKSKVNGSEEKKEDVPEQKEGKQGSKGKGRRNHPHDSDEVSLPPPSVNDLTLWPTPSVAQAEEPKKEEAARPEKPVVQRGSKWEKIQIEVPYTSPVPTKGSRGGRAGRGRGGSSAPGERAERANGNGNLEGEQRGRQFNGRGGYQGQRGGKQRSSSTGNYPSRKASVQNGPNEKKGKEPKEPVIENKEQQQQEGVTTNGTQTEKSRKPSNGPAAKTDEQTTTATTEARNASQERTQGQPRSEGNYGYREGGEGQRYPRGGERGRGGFRGRGGYHGQYANGHHNGNGNSHFQQPAQQFMQVPNGYQGQHHPRGGFRGARGQQAGPYAPYGRNYGQPQQQFYPQQFGGYDQFGQFVAQTPPVDMPFLIQQLNYYFSVDNLCKDMYLRKHMDSSGFVRLKLLMSFPKVQQKTKDMTHLRDAALQCPDLELAYGTDDIHIRKKDSWANWILPEDQRDESAKCDQGSWHIDPRQRTQYNNPTPPGEMSAAAEPFIPHPHEPHFYPQPLDALNAPEYPQPTSALSAAVPEFTPPASHPHPSQLSHSIPTATPDNIDDAGLDKLIVVMKTAPSTDSGPSSPVRTPAIINGEEMQTPPLDATMKHTPYPEFLLSVTAQRDSTGPQKTSSLISLYKFWSHVLVRQFKASMYQEFRTMAFEDANHGIRVGVEELLKFYERAIKEKDVVGWDLVRDFVELVRGEGRKGEVRTVDRLRVLLSGRESKRECRWALEQCLDREMTAMMGDGVVPAVGVVNVKRL